MRVLLSTDGSSHSRWAETFLSKFPFAEPIELTIVHVCGSPDLHYLGHDVSDRVNQLVDSARSEARQLLDAAVERCERWAGHVQAELLDGSPGKEIVAAAERLQVDLVVTASRGVGAMHRLLLGSVSEKVVKYAPCSVLVTFDPEGASQETRRILLACDNSLPSEAAIQRFSKLPLGPERSVHLYAVQEILGAFGMDRLLEDSPEWRQQVAAVQHGLERWRTALAATGAEVSSQLEQAPRASDAILEEAGERAVDLIVLGHSGRSGWDRVLLGSVALQVLHHAPCAVWIERPLEAQRSALQSGHE